MVLESIISRGITFKEAESYVRELAWRDYFQRVWQHKNIDACIKAEQENVAHTGMPLAIYEAKTGIQGIDESITTLYQTGYMHNHCRMYVASVTCNIGRTHWYKPAQWMYYHLLDGDWGSNACSWQWVAGCNSSKKYFANQENISKYTHTPLQNGFLNHSYEELAELTLPETLRQTTAPQLTTKLPQTPVPVIDTAKPTLVYTYYNLDPAWHVGLDANRVLLLEPSLFARYPVSPACIDFVLQLAENISGIQIFTGEFEQLKALTASSNVHYKEHPLNRHFSGTEEPRDWMDADVTGYFPSFFGYWKKIERGIKMQFDQHQATETLA